MVAALGVCPCVTDAANAARRRGVQFSDGQLSPGQTQLVGPRCSAFPGLNRTSARVLRVPDLQRRAGSRSWRGSFLPKEVLFRSIGPARSSRRRQGVQPCVCQVVVDVDSKSEQSRVQRFWEWMHQKVKVLDVRKGLNDKNGHFLDKLVVKEYRKLVQEVNSWEPQVRSLSDKQLQLKTEEFRLRLKRGETLEDVQPEAFAVVREASRRTLGMRHFDVQLIGGAVLHDGAIAEMKTGEGKTLVSPLAAYLNALTGEGVHVVTVNDYLVQRDAEWMGQIHRFLGLTVGLIQTSGDPRGKRSAYACDITYCNNTELGFDYLRDNICGKKEEMVLRWPKPFHFAVVDEVDSVLIDEGRNPLLVSSQSTKDAARYPVAAEVADFLIPDIHYKVIIKEKDIELTEEGVAAAELALGSDDLWDEKDHWARFVITAVKAKEIYQRDVHYIVKDGMVQIVDEFTGRVVENRRWSDGIHQAVEAKEGVRIQADTVTIAQITYQSFFKLYKKLSGMTGTAKTEETEFMKMFKMPVVAIPTNLPNIRQDYPLQLFQTVRGKWRQVREEVEFMYRQGRPVLVGTTSVEQSEYLSALLQEWMIPHNVLNARPKYAAREAEIVAQAGRKNAITLATNMAGRGTDIILGGNPEMLAKEILENSFLHYMTDEAPDIDTDGAPLSQMALSRIKLSSTSLERIAKASLAARLVCGRHGGKWSYRQAKTNLCEAIELARTEKEESLQSLSSVRGSDVSPLSCSIALAWLSIIGDCTLHCRQEGAEVKERGGLHVIGTSLHDSRRVDNQLRGRAGRQGDPGSTRFMISLEDEMIRKFNTDWATGFLRSLGFDEDMPIESTTLSKQVLALQKTAERFYFNQRKTLVEFDEVMEVQRKHVYSLRQSLLLDDCETCQQRIFQYMQAIADELVLGHVNSFQPPSSWNVEGLLKEYRALAHATFANRVPKFSAPTDVLADIRSDLIVDALSRLHGVRIKSLDCVMRAGLPVPYSSRGIRSKVYSLKRWFELTSQDSSLTGKYHVEVHLLRKYFGDILIGTYMEKLEISGLSSKEIDEIERILAVKALDRNWKDHLVNMARLRAAANVRSFGHMNPLEEYKIDGCRFFIAMLSAARRLTIESLLRPWVSADDERLLDLDYA